MVLDVKILSKFNKLKWQTLHKTNLLKQKQNKCFSASFSTNFRVSDSKFAPV